MTYPAVIARVAAAAERSGRTLDDITVVVVSKGHSNEEVLRIHDLGQRDFGENRAQELAAKTVELPDDIRWHFIGPLQTNKVRIVRPVTCLLHSFDRDDLGRAWLKGPGLAPPVLLQVNVGLEPQKHGFYPDDVVAACGRAVALGLDVQGLMAIPPLVDRAEHARPFFRLLRKLRDQAASHHPSVRQLSMGMSDDFEVAVEEGATIIRPGRAIFVS
ncbi:MAG: YggS family pyridoxal phosphate-dependent enzyme [Acidimicrobiia bacterium]